MLQQLQPACDTYCLALIIENHDAGKVGDKTLLTHMSDEAQKQAIQLFDQYYINQIEILFSFTNQYIGFTHQVHRCLSQISPEASQPIIDTCDQRYLDLVELRIKKELIHVAQDCLKAIQTPSMKQKAMDALDLYYIDKLKKKFEHTPVQGSLDQILKWIESIYNEKSKETATAEYDRFCTTQVNELLKAPAEMFYDRTRTQKNGNKAFIDGWANKIIDPKRKQDCLERIRDVYNAYCLQQMQAALACKTFTLAHNWARMIEEPQALRTTSLAQVESAKNASK